MQMNEVLYKIFKAYESLARYGAEENREAYGQDLKQARDDLLENTAEWLDFYARRVVQEANKVREAATAEGVDKHMALLREEVELLQRLVNEACDLLGRDNMDCIARRAFELTTTEEPRS